MSNRRYRAYPEYKDSGVEWLNRIPVHWTIQKLRNLGAFSASGIDKKIVPGEPLVDIVNYTDVYGNDTGIIPVDRELMRVSCSESKLQQHQILKGDLLFTPSSETIEDIGVSCLVNAARANTSFSYHLIRLKFSKQIAHDFKKYLCNNEYVLSQFSKAARGTTRQTLGRDDFKAATVPLPTLSEQTQIAAFLDHETAKIDRLIEKQEELIRLLKEKRQAVISHAVTKGLNPHAPLKDSGIEWLGQVPAHWAVLQFKFLIRSIDQGKSPECEGRLASPEEWGVLKSGCVNRGVFLQEEHKALPAKIAPTLAAEVKEGDLLMSRASGSTDLIGSVGLVGKVRSRLMMCDKIFRIHPESGVLPKFIWRMAASIPVRKQIELSINGAAGLANNLTKESIGRLWIARPPLAEQEAITDYLESRCARFDFLISNAEHQVTLLQERRTALISAAVTGKIDVRHWQSPVGSETGTPPDCGAFA